MVRVSRWFVVTIVALALLGAATSPVSAQVLVPVPTVACYPPAPVAVAPVTAYYAPAPVATAYYAPPAVAYAPAVSVTRYRYGLLGRRSVTVSTYAPARVAGFVYP